MLKEEYLNLQKRVKDLADAYYNEDNPKVSDQEYDQLMQKIKVAEKEHPDWITKDSITQVIGGFASSKFSKVEHDVPMLSIEDVFDKDSVEEWMLNVRKAHPDATFSVEEKIDGLSCTLRYRWRNSTFRSTEYGDYGLYELILAETRGNGSIGEDVTENVMQIDNIPHSIWLPIDTYGDEIQIRGEIYMPTENFERYNRTHPEKPAANARNLAAGTLRQKDASLVKERGLDIFIFNVQKVIGASTDLWNDHIASLNTLNSWIPTVLHLGCDDFIGASSCIDQFEHMRGYSGYDIDGAVIKINEVNYREEFKTSAKYSAGHIAYKYPQKEKQAEITNIEVGLGRTGKLSFTAVVRDVETKKPLQLNGTEVSRVTVNNMDYIKKHHIGIGGVYGIIKSGEIIPKLTDTIYKEPEKIYEVPGTCPFCGATLENKGSVDWYCINEACEERAIQQMIYFVGRDQMNIEGLSEETLRFLHKHSFINCYDPSSLYDMVIQYDRYGDIWGIDNNLEDTLPLSKRPGWSDVSVQNLIDSIRKSRVTTFERVLVSIGLPGIGHGQVKLLQKAIESYPVLDTEESYFDRLIRMRSEGFDFSSINGFGSVLSKTVDEYLDSLKHKKETLNMSKNEDGYYYQDEAIRTIWLLAYLEIPNIQKNMIKDTDTMCFDGLTFCCTGSIEQFKNRDELFTWIESQGGKTSSSISTKTSYLINNNNNSSSGKNKKAKELGIPIITEEQLLQMAKENDRLNETNDQEILSK